MKFFALLALATSFSVSFASPSPTLEGTPLKSLTTDPPTPIDKRQSIVSAIEGGVGSITSDISSIEGVIQGIQQIVAAVDTGNVGTVLNVTVQDAASLVSELIAWIESTW